MKVNEQFFKKISESTFKKTADIGFNHANENLPYITKTVRDIKSEVKKTSLVVSAGPSLHRQKSLDIIKKCGFEGIIISADGALGHCLRNGIIPDFVVTVDPDPNRIIRWFGDPRLSERPEDDYFQRQDLDPVLNNNEISKNNELIELVNSYGKKINVVISTSVSPEIPKRCLEAGMELYWWNPIYDDYEETNSLTRRLYNLNKVPCMVTGGNVGSSAWVFATSILKSHSIILVGMDMSYPPGTNVKNTQYYEFLSELIPDNPERGLIEIYNPYLKETWITDPAYFWYKENFLQMVSFQEGKTYNCTEGGILFGNGIEFIDLEKALLNIKDN